MFTSPQQASWCHPSVAGGSSVDSYPVRILSRAEPQHGPKPNSTLLSYNFGRSF